MSHNNQNNSDNHYNIVAQNPESTVVAAYFGSQTLVRETAYQSEAQLENEFISLLESQAYTRLTITTDADLVTNLRAQLEKLNKYTFSDREWERFFESEIANPNQSIEEKTRTIQEDYIKNLHRDDGTVKNIYLIDKASIHNNALQVINQYATDEGQRANRYDVTILVNGFPMVHVELKRRGVALQEAFNQIDRYQRESFWADSGLFEYVQLFVISSGTHTKYYSNTTRHQHIKESSKTEKSSKGKKTSHSFEFTNWWADSTNRPIVDLIDFAKTFFAKHSLLNVLTKYCVFTADGMLLVMRPYQIVATERILNTIEISTNYKKMGSIEAGGYVWHTTGSGKTLTSFKTAQMASKLSYIDKVLFIVDRKDLDYQTMVEYDKFEKGAANSNTSTKILGQQLADDKNRIIITTIQKLSRFIEKNKGHTIFAGHVVLIFDECHRSQFGGMHKSITKAFSNYHLFGFTGTPIFAANSTSRASSHLKLTQQPSSEQLQTTQQAFGQQLHTYTIVNAIADNNVLPFKVDYVSTVREAEDIDNKKVTDIDREASLASPRRISNIVEYIREHFNDKTKRNTKSYTFDKLVNVSEVVQAQGKKQIEHIREKIRLSGFNSIFAVSSINYAKLYYNEFKKQQQDVDPLKKLKVGLIFSYGANEAEGEAEGVGDENSENTTGLDQSSRDFLEAAIQDYNIMFGTSYDTSSDKFQNYYKDLSQRVKNREVDILIVVNMFLTGFDATTLNTLWVDKNLRLHGLVQAYSRTNRILNSIKTFGHIVCFRNLEKATNEAISLFGDKEAGGIVLLKSFEDYFGGYTDNKKEVKGYESLTEELQAMFPLGELIVSEQGKKDFIKLFNGILKLRNILSSFDDFAQRDTMTQRDMLDYHGRYIDLYQEFRKNEFSQKEYINDDLVFEMELIKQVEINIDYILELIRTYHDKHTVDKELLVDINKAIDSSVELRNKKELINQFITSLNTNSDVDTDWKTYVEQSKINELDTIIAQENLNKDETYTFIHNAFRDGIIDETGTKLTKVLPPMSRFSASGERAIKRENVLYKLRLFFQRFFDI